MITKLFLALDAACRVVIDGMDVDATFTQTSSTRRRLDLANESWVTVDNQDIDVKAGTGSFRDIHGGEHTIGFVVERPLSDADLASAHKRAQDEALELLGEAVPVHG